MSFMGFADLFQVEELLQHLKRIGGRETKGVVKEMEDTTIKISDLDRILEDISNSGTWWA